MAVRIHQIYYDDAQRAALDPAFIPYDNRTNPRPEWREYHVFRTEWLAGRCGAGDVTGFLSWKFGAKTGIAGRAFVEFVERHPGHDVYFVNPSRVEPRPFTGIWQQAEVHHPGIIGLAQRIFDRVGVAVDLATLEQPREQVLFCNYWAGTRRFWDDYMAAFEDTITATSTKRATWYVIPADHKWIGRAIVSAAIADAIGSLDLKPPAVSPERLKELAAARRRLQTAAQ